MNAIIGSSLVPCLQVVEMGVKVESESECLVLMQPRTEKLPPRLTSFENKTGNESPDRISQKFASHRRNGLLPSR